MIVLRTRSFMTEEDMNEASKLYAEMAGRGVLVIPESIDIVKIPDEAAIRVVAADEDPDCGEDPNGTENNCEENTLQQ